MTVTDITTSTETNSAPLLPPPEKQGGRFALIWIFIVLIVGVLGASSYFILQQLNGQQALVNGLRNQLEEQKKTVELQQRALEENLEKELVEQQSSMQAGLNDLAEQVDNTAARLLALSSVSRDDWKLAEAQYLLRLADQRILLEKDSQNAIALALSADEVLRDIDQADLVGVRKLLAEEIAVLKLVEIVDREGVYLRLAAISNQIDAIPFIEPLGAQEETLVEQQTPVDETIAQKIKRGFYSLLHKLGAYVRVRDHGRAINAVLPPAEQKYLQQNLRLMLEQAQVALLRNDAQIYRESLVKAQNWINQYYSLNTQASAVLTELQELQAEDIAPELTNFSNTSVALAEYIEKQDRLASARRGVRK